MHGCIHKHMYVHTNTPGESESCWGDAANRSSSSSDMFCEETCVAEEVDGCSSWAVAAVPSSWAEAAVPSSWAVAAVGAPKYFKSAPEFALKYSMGQTFRIGTK